ncbi:MAG TPA: TetR family transcriptional regulator [Pilimelia sp.]|nr:TetR family transcriptional regulator [Pilimelia sp.]
MPPDASATKARLLDAAVEEFARYGVAGARVDRIAESAQANKRLIYLHFGNKERLFEIVVERALGELADAVPFDADDLPRYAGALFDYFVAHPQVLRLAAWKQLEASAATAVEIDAYRPKVAALADAQRSGHVTGEIGPVDLLALIVGLVGAWFNASPALWTLAGDDPGSPDRVARQRAAVVAAVRALVAPTTSPVASPR